MVGQRLSWIGLTLDGYVIKDLAGEGAFSWVFRSVHANGSSSKAIKVAKPAESILEGGPTGCLPTQALVQTTGGIAPLNPDADELLRIQAGRLQRVKDSALVRVETLAQRSGTTYFTMPYLRGINLRQYMKSGPVPIKVLRDLAMSLARLSENPSFGYHGDLKPENIMITPNGVVLVDPGYFGSLTVQTQDSSQPLTGCAVTTPQYYPFLKPDDLFATGIIIWEACCRTPLLTKASYSADFNKSFIGKQLWELVRAEEIVGKFHFSSILGVKPPSILRPGMPPQLESLVLKAVRVQFTEDGQLELADGFTSFNELVEALDRLLDDNIVYV